MTAGPRSASANDQEKRLPLRLESLLALKRLDGTVDDLAWMEALLDEDAPWEQDDEPAELDLAQRRLPARRSVHESEI